MKLKHNRLTRRNVVGNPSEPGFLARLTIFAFQALEFRILKFVRQESRPPKALKAQAHIPKLRAAIQVIAGSYNPPHQGHLASLLIWRAGCFKTTTEGTGIHEAA